MSKVRRIDWSPAEWLSGTRGLGMDETAIYITVLNIIYDRGAACPNDAGFIAGQFRQERRHRKAGDNWLTSKRTNAALACLIELGKLHVTPDGQGLTNGRAERELNKARERMRGATQAGKANGRGRSQLLSDSSQEPHESPMRAPSEPHESPMGTSQFNQINGLGRTSVRIKQPSTIKDHDTVPAVSTDAAREPAPDVGAPARAPAVLEPIRVPKAESPDARATRERLAEVTAAKRAAFMKRFQ